MNDNQSPFGGETPESDKWLLGYDDTPMVLDAYAKMQELERDRNKWKEKADHLRIACKVWEDAGTIHPVNGVNCDIFGNSFSLHNVLDVAPPPQMPGLDK